MGAVVSTSSSSSADLEDDEVDAERDFEEEIDEVSLISDVMSVTTDETSFLNAPTVR